MATPEEHIHQLALDSPNSTTQEPATHTTSHISSTDTTMTFLRSSAPFLAFLWIALLGLALSYPAHSAVIPSTDSASSYQANSVHRRVRRAPPPANAEKSEPVTPASESVYIITLDEKTTPEQYAAFKKYLIDQGIKIKFEYNIIKGFAVYLNQSQLQTIKNDSRVKIIEKDSTVNTNKTV